jgi:hypothetical protein
MRGYGNLRFRRYVLRRTDLRRYGDLRGSINLPD